MLQNQWHTRQLLHEPSAMNPFLAMEIDPADFHNNINQLLDRRLLDEYQYADKWENTPHSLHTYPMKTLQHFSENIKSM